MGVEVTRGVVGVADHDGTRIGRDNLLELLDGRQGEARLDVAGDGDNLGVAELGEGVVIGVIRLGDDDFVARIEADGESHLQSLATTVGDNHLVGGDIDAVAVIIVAKGTAIGGDTGGVAVFQHTLVLRHLVSLHRQGLEGACRGLDVGLADIQVIHVHTTFFGGIGEGDELTDGRLRQLQSFV